MSRPIGHLRRRLSIDIKNNDPHEESFIANDEVFIKDNVAINSTGIVMRNNPKKFTLLYEELVIGDMIGRGSSSIVLQAYHAPTGTPLALKVINLFDRSKREQLIREIIALYDAQCPNLITFYGAFYREGSITIAIKKIDTFLILDIIESLLILPLNRFFLKMLIFL